MDNSHKPNNLTLGLISIALLGITSIFIYFFHFLPLFKTLSQYNKLTYTKFATAPIPLSLSVQKDQFGNQTATIIGVVKKEYEKNGRFFMEIDTLVNNGIISLITDFGTKDTHMSEHTTIIINSASQFATPIGTQFDHTYRLVSNEQLFKKKQLKGKVIKLDVMISASSNVLGTQCNQTCQLRRKELDSYSERNKKLINIDDSLSLKLLKKVSLQIGVPYQISVNYNDQ